MKEVIKEKLDVEIDDEGIEYIVLDNSKKGVLKVRIETFLDLLDKNNISEFTYKELSKLDIESGYLIYIEKWKEQGVFD